MNKSWMRCTDTSRDVYIKGVDNFLQFAFNHSKVDGEIPCPCTLCNNVLNWSRADVREYLILSGIAKNYTRWFHHGESAPKKQPINQKEEGKEQGDLSQTKEKEQGDPSQKRSDDIFEMIYDDTGHEFMEDFSGVKFKQGDTSKPTSKIFKLVEDVAQ
ncbi:hypothetical protein FXO38_04982 [Capsicum annuum]|nr:hypothetical protein FXO38_04982 [Capsicum annuum]